MKLSGRGRHFAFMNAEMKLKLKLKLKLHVIELDKVKELIYLLSWNKDAYMWAVWSLEEKLAICLQV